MSTSSLNSSIDSEERSAPSPVLRVKQEKEDNQPKEPSKMAASTATAPPPTLPLPERFRHEMENISMPKTQFLKMVERVKNYETRLQAVRNLQDLLHEKNKEIFFSKRDLKTAEAKMKDKDTQIKELGDKLIVQHESLKHDSMKHDSGFSSSGLSSGVLSSGGLSSGVLSPPNSESGMIDDDHSYTRAECSNCKSLKSDTSSVALSKSPSDLPVNSTSGSVSKAVFDGVVKEYEILKRTVQDLLQTSGASVKGLVNTKEQEQTIANLRRELRECKDQLEQMCAGNSSQLIVQQKAKLQRDVAAKTMLVKKLEERCQQLNREKQDWVRKIADTKAGTESMDTDQALDFSSNKTKPDVLDHSQTQELAAVRQQMTEEAARYQQEICDLRKQLSREMQAKQQAQDEIQQYIRNIANIPGSPGSGRTVTYIDALNKLSSEKDALVSQIETLKQQYMSEKVALENQIHLKQRDLEVMKSEKDNGNQYFERMRSRDSDCISSLSNEVKRLEDEVRQEKTKSMVAERKLMQQRHHASLVSPMALSGHSDCGQSEPLWLGSHSSPVHHQPIEVDGPVGEDTQTLVCKRCEREFRPDERRAYEDHLGKCLP